MVNKELGAAIGFDPLFGPPQERSQTPDAYVTHHLCDPRTPRVLVLNVDKSQYRFVEGEPESLSSLAASSIEAEVRAFWRIGNSDPTRIVYIPPQTP